MFETEDMLPRQPPEPSAPPLSSERFVKPEVPEVSIILGKPTELAEMPTAYQQPSSYAAWKKQILPRTTYPPTSKGENINNANSNVLKTRSTVFPLRAASAPVSHENDHLTTLSSEKTYRHSLENANQLPTTLSNYIPNTEHRRSVDSLSQRSNAFSTERTLTICASTQTDSTATTTNSLEYLIKAIDNLQEEQRQTRLLLEAFLRQQTQNQDLVVSNVFCCDMATQCDIQKDPTSNVQEQPSFHQENSTVHQALPNVKFYSPVIRSASRPVVPIAQSTQYRSNTPLKSNLQQSAPSKSAAPANKCLPALPKPCTEKSMVMNELALKYLPSEKLNELMQQTNITAEKMPLREIDNFNKAPVDISTASFHYLRKYRLLPQQEQSGSSPSRNCLNALEHNQHLQESPIAANVEIESQHLDLEHIKRQPKFL